MQIASSPFSETRERVKRARPRMRTSDLLFVVLAGLRPLALRDVCFCVTPENYFTFFLPSTAAEEEEAAPQEPQEAAPHVAIATAELLPWTFAAAERTVLMPRTVLMSRKSERQIRRSSEQKLDKNSKNSKKPRQNWVENLQAAQRRNSRKINSATTPHATHTHTHATRGARTQLYVMMMMMMMIPNLSLNSSKIISQFYDTEEEQLGGT
eukprot:scaffold3187_cov130-Skeletonema_menzelii.AAC.3